MYDNTCKFLAENFPEDIASWLLGEATSVSQLEPSELSVEPLRADSLIFLELETTILHVEFQVQAKADIPFRMTDYYLRLYRRSPEKSVRQIVLYLRRTNSPLVYQSNFQTGRLSHEFEVIRIWERPWEEFLARPGLYPFAVLAESNNREAVLETVREEINKIAEEKEQREIAASTYVLAGLVLEEEMIRFLLREEIMRESVTYQAIQREGLQQGLQQERSLILKLLNRKLGNLSQEQRSRLDSLSIEQLETLAEALLEFSSSSDLDHWLEQNTQ